VLRFDELAVYQLFAGLHKENDLWHVIRHGVGEVDAEVNKRALQELYYSSARGVIPAPY